MVSEANKLSEIPLIDAVLKNDVEEVQKLIDIGADLEIRSIFNQTPLILATRFGYTKIVGILIDAGADLEVKDNAGYTPLMIAEMAERLLRGEIVRILR